MKVICAGQSDAGMAFSAQYADFNFCFGKGVNTPTAFAPIRCADETGRQEQTRARRWLLMLFMVIADETDDVPLAPNGNTTKRARMKRR